MGKRSLFVVVAAVKVMFADNKRLCLQTKGQSQGSGAHIDYVCS